MSLIQEDLEPGVINTAMVMKALEEERPAGEAGRLAVEDGIVLKEVTSLRLEFLNILMIDHLWMMTSLVKLQLGNNIIGKIEGLDSLVNLKELDLSFNNIEVIENLGALVKLEVLTLFENQISKLENLETLVNLVIFSIGNNRIEYRNDVIYLRQFHHLRSLNMAGNPCVYNSDEDFRQYICAFLPKLTYYEYRTITAEERAVAEESYKAVLQKLVESEEKQRQSKDEAEARAKELTHHAEAFVENLNEDQLFSAMFESDTHGKALLSIGNTVMDIYNTFYEETMNITQQLFKEGLEQHESRQEEIRQYNKCVSAAKEQNMVASQQYTEKCLQTKAEVFLEIHNMLKVVEKLADTEDGAYEGDYVARMGVLSDKFNEECHRTWYNLMTQEFTLYEQLEDINQTFEQNMTGLVSTFMKAARSFFVEIRNLEAGYNEEMSEAANAYLTNLNTVPDSVPPKLRQIMVNKEALNNVTTQSHESHLHAIDSREDQLLKRIQKWSKDYCDKITMHEIQRCRKKVTEIGHFLDIQKEEFEDLQNLLLNAVASLAPSGGASGEMEEISDNEMTIPEPPQEDGGDIAPADLVPSENTTTDIAPAVCVPPQTTTDIAPADLVPSENTTTDIAPAVCVPPQTTTDIAPADLVPSENTTTDIAPAVCVPPQTTTDIAPAVCVPPQTTITDKKSTEASGTTNESAKTAESTANV